MTSQPVFRLSLQLARVAAYARPTMFYIPLVNIHDLDCTMLHARIFELGTDAGGTLTATAPSIHAHMRPYRVARMLNQLRRGHRVWPCSS